MVYFTRFHAYTLQLIYAGKVLKVPSVTVGELTEKVSYPASSVLVFKGFLN